MQHFDDTPDDSRPRNPWPRLIALGAVLLAAFLAAGACLVAFVNTGAEPELRIPLTQIETGVPRFEPITNWGSDDDQFTYGIWIVQIPEVGTRAYLSRAVTSGCHVQWEATDRVGDVTGVFKDRCNDSVFSIDGNVLKGSATRNLDQFETTATGGTIVVDFSVLRIGTCRDTPAAGEPICDPGGGATTRPVPTNRPLPDDFAER